jgi:2'-5' RNA ligase
VRPEPRRTALVVVASEREPILLEARRRWVVPDRRVPPHITILYPFVSAADVEDAPLGALERICASTAPFDYALVSVESFPDAVWLAPDPVAPFVDLISRTREAFPAYPPYGDPAAGAPVPHCTVRARDEPGRRDRAVDEVRDWFRPILPIRCHASAVTLLEELADSTWAANRSLPLGGSA